MSVKTNKVDLTRARWGVTWEARRRPPDKNPSMTKTVNEGLSVSDIV